MYIECRMWVRYMYVDYRWKRAWVGPIDGAENEALSNRGEDVTFYVGSF